jgi:membrane protease YdiL (CAAX protease family)
VALYARTRNTVSAMIAHLVINAIMVLLLPNVV